MSDTQYISKYQMSFNSVRYFINPSCGQTGLRHQGFGVNLVFLITLFYTVSCVNTIVKRIKQPSATFMFTLNALLEPRRVKCVMKW